MFLAFRLHPNYVHAMNNLGNILKEQNELSEAEQLLSKAVAVQYVVLQKSPKKQIVSNHLNCYPFHKQLFSPNLSRPDFAAAWMNLGIVQNSLRKFDAAEESYWNALRYRRKYPDCYYNLGRLVRFSQFSCFIERDKLNQFTLPDKSIHTHWIFHMLLSHRETSVDFIRISCNEIRLKF